MKKEIVFRIVLALCIFFLVYQFGFKPIFTGPEHANWAEGLSSAKATAGRPPYDVIVLGEDPDGIAAAVSAARLGAKTLLIAERDDLGGIVADCLLPQLETPTGIKGNLLDAGILGELYKALDSQISADKYISTVDKLVKQEKTLDVVYDSVFDSPVLEGGRLTGVRVLDGSQGKTFEGRFFIDSTRDGKLLEACGVPYFTGSGDLNLKDNYMPAGLNFEMTGPGIDEIKNLFQSKKGELAEGLSDYRTLDTNIRIDDLKAFYPEDDKVILQGLEIANIDPTNGQKMEQAYGTAVKEAENLADFLSKKFTQFKGWKLTKTAGSLYLRENRHFSGLYRLTVNDVLGNMYFDDTVAMGSYPVQTGKFAAKGVYIAGKPQQYGIPLGCLIPAKVGNLLMTGSKASYSSLAASSSGTLGTGIATGEAAGVVAVYSLLRQADPSTITKDSDMIKELRGYLTKQGMYLPLQNTGNNNKNLSNWSYPAVKQLLSLGLIAGGEGNNFYFDMQAKERDLATVLLNGIYRLGDESYTLELDSRIRPYFNDSVLTRENAAQMLDELYGDVVDASSAYANACKKDYINGFMQLQLKDKKTLTMDDVYYLGDYNIKLFTGKDIKD